MEKKVVSLGVGLTVITYSEPPCTLTFDVLDQAPPNHGTLTHNKGSIFAPTGRVFRGDDGQWDIFFVPSSVQFGRKDWGIIETAMRDMLAFLERFKAFEP